jgi:hypothetical protein
MKMEIYLKRTIRLVVNELDKLCPDETFLKINEVEAKLKSNIDKRNELLAIFPDAPHSPNFIGKKEIDEMILQAKKMDNFELYCSFKPNGQWNFKQFTSKKIAGRKEFDDIGNFLWGVLTKAKGLSNFNRDTANLIWQTYKGNVKLDLEGIKDFGDDHLDRIRILDGENNYIKYENSKSEENKQEKNINNITEPRLNVPSNDKIILNPKG